MIKIYKALILIDKGFIIIRTVLIEKESYLKLCSTVYILFLVRLPENLSLKTMIFSPARHYSKIKSP